MGLLGNIKEYEMWQASRHPNLAEVVTCIPGGWLNVYPRYHLLGRGLTNDEADGLPVYGHDPKANNYGLNNEGDIMVLDYGHSDCWPKYTKNEVEELYESGML